MAITYRKTKTNEWVAYGPATQIKAGAVVTISKKSGETKREMIASVGKPFVVNGVRMVYGYIDNGVRVAADGGLVATRSNRTSGRTCDECSYHSAPHPRRDSSGIAGYVCTRCNRSADYELSFA